MKPENRKTLRIISIILGTGLIGFGILAMIPKIGADVPIGPILMLLALVIVGSTFYYTRRTTSR